MCVFQKFSTISWICIRAYPFSTKPLTNSRKLISLHHSKKNKFNLNFHATFAPILTSNAFASREEKNRHLIKTCLFRSISMAKQSCDRTFSICSICHHQTRGKFAHPPQVAPVVRDVPTVSRQSCDLRRKKVPARFVLRNVTCANVCTNLHLR